VREKFVFPPEKKVKALRQRRPEKSESSPTTSAGDDDNAKHTIGSPEVWKNFFCSTSLIANSTPAQHPCVL
jgi:hypothetical protein